jgi:O-antigen ligase
VGPEEERDFSAQSRILLWKAGWTMFRESPILGKGMDNFPLISFRPQYTGFYAGKSARPYTPGSTGTGFVAHSTWFQTLGEGGIFVSLPFFLLFPMAFYALWKVSRIRFARTEKRWYESHCIAMTGLWIAFIIASTFGSHIKLDFLWWYMGLTSAIALNARERLAREHIQRRQAVIEAQREAWERDVGLAPARLDQPVRY